MDKKFLIILVAVLVVILLLGIAAYRYLIADKANIQNSVGGIGTEIETQPQTGLFICADKCGDGVCQAPDPECKSMNCVCLENQQECPQDCK